MTIMAMAENGSGYRRLTSNSDGAAASDDANGGDASGASDGGDDASPNADASGGDANAPAPP